MLEVKNLVVSYGAIKALRGISFSVEQGEVISLIGSNGAGKTTTLHSISNLIKKNSGSIFFEGTDITNLSADKIVKMGLIQVPEGRRVFANLSVKENLEMGAYLRKDKEQIKKDMEWGYELFPRLKERLSQLAGTLSGGEQQMLAMARALMSKPKLLLLDEPSMGLAPILVDEIFEIIKKISSAGTTILLVEQNAYKALSIANRAYILETGEITKDGKASDLITDKAVISAYLGG
ncbi:MAG: ABC transporter ATP-binding protein [Treponema sp.]|nr:ABC transporter ATP-binding protein [Spirochaetia bacterium]MDD7611298.1 ABC transporter ATP-binding protein [Spirochaetales bacterium]MDY4830905.1 ABC transporter ATP-binding protein [Treponema sp.]MDY5916682.1 ABC transporter ATP-binding protein [Treponema sp.]MDY5918702.1 ABC transporter ATP-binding protein [Treponema sp.]